jgi:phosphoglycolate phosphatase
VEFVGNGARRLVEQALVAAGGSDDAATSDRALAVFLARYGAHLLDTTVLYPGVGDALRELRAAGRTLSIATNKPQAFARSIVEGLGLGQAFFAILGGDSLPTRKPDPAIVHELVARAEIPAAQTLLVGDSVVDVATARGAGVAVCAVAWGLTPAAALRAASPDFWAERPDEIVRL